MTERRFKVVGGLDTPPPPNEECVSHLEEALAAAKAGILQNVIIIGYTHDKQMVNGWSDWSHVLTAIGALDQTKMDYRMREIVQNRPVYYDGML